MNPYAYVGGNPETLIDQTGHDWGTLWPFAATVVGIAAGNAIQSAVESTSSQPLTSNQFAVVNQSEQAIGSAVTAGAAAKINTSNIHAPGTQQSSGHRSNQQGALA